jgi:hypothetical protein
MKFRFLLLGVYLLLVLLFLGFLFEVGDRHGWNPFEFVVYLALPTGLLSDLLPPRWIPEDGLLSLVMFLLAGSIQWALIGYLIDRLLARFRQKSLREEPG